MGASKDVLVDVMVIVREMLNCPADTLHADARFFADLGLSSIDVIVLGDRLEQHYATPLRFADALPELAHAGIDDVTLGELASFVEMLLRQAAQGS